MAGPTPAEGGGEQASRGWTGCVCSAAVGRRGLCSHGLGVSSVWVTADNPGVDAICVEVTRETEPSRCGPGEH